MKLKMYVAETKDGKPRLIEANTKAGALAHAAKTTITVRLATPRDAANLRDEGVEIETVGGEG